MTTTMPPTIQIPPDPQTTGITKDTKSEAPMKVNDVMAQMLAVALASGITKNATFMFTLPAAHVYYRSVASDMNADFHDTIAHIDAGNNAVTGTRPAISRASSTRCRASIPSRASCRR